MKWVISSPLFRAFSSPVSSMICSLRYLALGVICFVLPRFEKSAISLPVMAVKFAEG